MSGRQPSPELRVCFEADAQAVLQKVEAILPNLDREEPDFRQIQPLRDTLHGLHGAAAQVGGQAVAAAVGDLERLLEVAASFQYGAPDRARQMFRLIHEILPALREAIRCTLADQQAEAEVCSRAIRERIRGPWGDYFYGPESGTEEGDQRRDSDLAASSGAGAAALSGQNTVPVKQAGGTACHASSPGESSSPSEMDVARMFLEGLVIEASQASPPHTPWGGSTGSSPAMEAEEDSGMAEPPGSAGGAETADTPDEEVAVWRDAGRTSDPPVASHNVASQDQVALDFLQSLGVSTDSIPGRQTPPTASAPAPVNPVAADRDDSGLGPETATGGCPSPSAGEVVELEVLACFVQETEESLEQLDERLLVWDQNPNDQEAAYSVYRLIHSLKGAAQSVGLSSIGRLLHDLEDLLEPYAENPAQADHQGLVSLVLEVAGMVRTLTAEAQSGASSPATQVRLQDLIQRLARHKESGLVPQAPDAAQSAGAPAEGRGSGPVSGGPRDSLDAQTIRVDSRRLDLLMNLVGELVINRTRLEKKLNDITRLKQEWQLCRSRLLQAATGFQDKIERPASGRDSGSDPASSVVPWPRAHVRGTRPVAPGEAVSEPEQDPQEDLHLVTRSLIEATGDAEEILSLLTRMVDSMAEETGQFRKLTTQLQEEMTRARMVPVAGLFRRLHRVVQDAASKEGKNVDVQWQGADARLDKAILDRVYQPLLHVVRNAVSHGIEDASEREQRGKPATGQLRLSAFYQSNQLVIEITDDGQGLNYERIRAEATRRGLLGAEERPSPEALAHLIFAPGFTTASRTSDVSGRGVGLDVVRKEITQLNGTVHILSEAGAGCTFVVRLPLTLSIMQAMLVRVGSETLALPLDFIEHVQDARQAAVAHSGQDHLLHIGDALVPWVPLGLVLGLNADRVVRGDLVVMRLANRRLALQVDRVVHRQDIVVKPVRALFVPPELYAGATVSAEGRVILIANLPGILESVRDGLLPSDRGTLERRPPEVSDQEEPPAVLVVDDSLSVRKVMEKDLRALGCEVTLAADGLDALEKLRTRAYGLVLTDLEMPRMHGFDLITEMRLKAAWRDIPVIVVSSRNVEKHRRRAAELRCEAYLCKPVSPGQLAAQVRRVLESREVQPA